jgi:hypothetical protein
MASSKSKPKSQPKGVPRGTKIPVKTGGYLIAGAGNGPKKGAPNAGRPRDEWKARLQAMASSDAVLDHVHATLQAGPSDPFFHRALEYVTDHGYGRATQPIELSGEVSIAENLNAARARALNRDTD